MRVAPFTFCGGNMFDQDAAEAEARPIEARDVAGTDLAERERECMNRPIWLQILAQLS